jgi:fructuronate reductase
MGDSTTGTPRLSRATLATVPATLDSRGVSAAALQLDPADLSIGIVHFGIGAFHRAHQAVFTEDAMAATGERRWGILGVTGRTDSVVQQLRPQDCLYGVLERGADADADALRVVASVRDVAWPGAESERITEAVAAGTTHVATLTITEKGYLRTPSGDADLTLDAVRADVAVIAAELARAEAVAASDASVASRTPVGLLVRGLARRFRRGGEPFTVVSCDNVVDNGHLTKQIVMSLAESSAAQSVRGPGSRRGEPDAPAADFVAWLRASVTFPSTMVDRLTPATTDDDRQRACELLGLRDEALVVAESFRQWVIEDDFAGPRPAWERAGAIITADVAPYERAKLRILNGSHSMLAYLGALAGHETIAQAVADERLRAAVLQTLNDDILPTVAAPRGMELAEYRDSVLHRFANPQLKHATRQVAMDGSHKVPLRWLAPAGERLAAGRMPRGIALAVAGWITYIASTSDADSADLDDPLARTLQAAVGDTASLADDPVAAVERIFAVDDVFGGELRASAAFRAVVVEQLPVVRDLVAR